MIRFVSASDAFSWSAEVLIIWRSGKAFDPNPELFRGGTGGLGAVLVAIQIEGMAGKACTGKCREVDEDCFLGWYMPCPLTIPEAKSISEKNAIMECIAQFEDALRMVGWLE